MPLVDKIRSAHHEFDGEITDPLLKSNFSELVCYALKCHPRALQDLLDFIETKEVATVLEKINLFLFLDLVDAAQSLLETQNA